MDSVNSHKEFCAKQGLTFKLLSAIDFLRSMLDFKTAARNTFLIDPQGKNAKLSSVAGKK